MPNFIRISKEVEFDSGHRVPKHESKCRNPHGHRYRVQIHCIGDIIEEDGPDQGMLIDFDNLKTFLVEEVHDVLDHGFIVYEGDADLLDVFGIDFSEADQGWQPRFGWKVVVFPYVPTAENIARWCWEQLEPRILGHFRNNLLLSEVRAWETPTSVARYYGPNGGAPQWQPE